MKRSWVQIKPRWLALFSLHLPFKATSLQSKRYLIVGNHSGAFFCYTRYVPWVIWLAKSRFHEYLWGSGDQSPSNEIVCYNKMFFNLNDVIQNTAFFLLRIETNAHVLNGKPNLRYKTLFHWLVIMCGILMEPMKLTHFLFIITRFS